MDVVHLYERSQRMMLLAPLTGAPAVDRDAFNAMVRELMDEARARARGRGPELGRRRGQPRAGHALRRADPLQAGVVAAAVPRVRGRRARGLRALRAGVQRGVQPARGQRAGRRLHRHVRAARGGPGPGARAARRCETDRRAADARRHAARRSSASGWTRRSTSSRRCSPATRSSGPAIVQAAYTTAVIPPGRRFTHRPSTGSASWRRGAERWPSPPLTRSWT